jgi:hypothetical protein
MTLEEALVSVWRQALVENAKAVELAGRRYPVGRTARRGLRQVDFVFEGQPLRGIEQNPETRSRWAQLARGGAKVMQFLEPFGGRGPARRYIAVVVNGKVTLYR